ncbi:MAG TPA: 6-pyruvoyl-tetrahydropterin synthase-related protein, partial [Acidimicrobiales bacterium]
MRRPSGAALAAAIVILGVAGITLWQLHPSLVFLDTTPAGGDTGAHVLVPAFLRDHLLPHGRLTGWSPSWYDGFPALTFYFPLPSLIIVAFNLVLPYGVAFKLVTVLGLLTLPLAAYAFGRMMDMRDPGPACLAAATLPFLFDRTFTIYGGNVASTLAGEFAFSISLSLALVFLGVVAKGQRSGRHRALAAVLLAVTALCHVIPTFFALAGWAVLTLMRPARRTLWWTASTGVVGGALVGFWAVPFLARLAYTNDMGWEKITTYHKTLLPASLDWLVALALVGVVASVALRRRTGIFLSVMAVLSWAGFCLVPQSRLWNARLLPFWFLCLYLLAGVAVAELGAAAVALWRGTWRELWDGGGGRWVYLESFHEHLEGGPIDDGWVTRTAAQVAAALRPLHDAGRGHGSVRPRTILIRSDGPVDVRAGVDGEPLLEVLGYASPEGIDGKAATPTSDVWSLGAVVYE